jgi:hypothetical protein
MTSKIKVDNINKVSDDSNIIKKCGTTVTVGAASDGVRTGSDNLQAADGGNLISQSGTTITLGASGDTIALASGASQTGFGNPGQLVDWQTSSIKTATFTAVNGEGYFINQGSAITANLPAGSAGAIVAFADYARNFETYNFVISPNGSEKIGGIAQDLSLRTNGQALTLIYVDATKGWINVQNAEDTETGTPPFICASVSGVGNTLVTAPDCANAKIATFVGPGSFTVNSAAPCAANNIVSYMIVAGGGSGGYDSQAGGGGAGGFRELKSPSTPYTASPLDGYPTPGNRVTVSAQAYAIVVGGGGTSPGSGGNNGSPSSFGGITSAGGGYARGSGNPGLAGGSGGGGAENSSGGAGNTPPVSPPQGNSGGPSSNPTGGGGGGATASGSSGPPQNGGPGGAGATTSITSTPTAYAGGGGGGGYSPSGSGGTGGAGGGANGGCYNNPGKEGNDATANTGGGGGGNGWPTGGVAGGQGGSGIVVIRYRFS